MMTVCQLSLTVTVVWVFLWFCLLHLNQDEPATNNICVEDIDAYICFYVEAKWFLAKEYTHLNARF